MLVTSWCWSVYAFVCSLWLSGADSEQLALTDQLFDAAFGELSGSCSWTALLAVGDFNVEPTKIPCLAKGILAGLWVDLELLGLWLVVCSLLLPVCVSGVLVVVIVGIFMVGCPPRCCCSFLQGSG